MPTINTNDFGYLFTAVPSLLANAQKTIYDFQIPQAAGMLANVIAFSGLVMGGIQIMLTGNPAGFQALFQRIIIVSVLLVTAPYISDALINTYTAEHNWGEKLIEAKVATAKNTAKEITGAMDAALFTVGVVTLGGSASFAAVKSLNTMGRIGGANVVAHQQGMDIFSAAWWISILLLPIASAKFLIQLASGLGILSAIAVMKIGFAMTMFPQMGMGWVNGTIKIVTSSLLTLLLLPIFYSIVLDVTYIQPAQALEKRLKSVNQEWAQAAKDRAKIQVQKSSSTLSPHQLELGYTEADVATPKPPSGYQPVLADGTEAPPPGFGDLEGWSKRWQYQFESFTNKMWGTAVGVATMLLGTVFGSAVIWQVTGVVSNILGGAIGGMAAMAAGGALGQKTSGMAGATGGAVGAAVGGAASAMMSGGQSSSPPAMAFQSSFTGSSDLSQGTNFASGSSKAAPDQGMNFSSSSPAPASLATPMSSAPVQGGISVQASGQLPAGVSAQPPSGASQGPNAIGNYSMQQSVGNSSGGSGGGYQGTAPSSFNIRSLSQAPAAKKN